MHMHQIHRMNQCCACKKQRSFIFGCLLFAGMSQKHTRKHNLTDIAGGIFLHQQHAGSARCFTFPYVWKLDILPYGVHSVLKKVKEKSTSGNLSTGDERYPKFTTLRNEGKIQQRPTSWPERCTWNKPAFTKRNGEKRHENWPDNQQEGILQREEC